MLVVAVLGVSYASSMRAWLQQRSDINTLSAQIATRQASVGTLEQDKLRWHDPAYIRTQARLRFGWLMPGETGFRVIDDSGQILQSGSSLSDPAASRPKASAEWWEQAWDSVVAAGEDPAARQQGKERGTHRAPAESIGRVPHPAKHPEQITPGDRLAPETGAATVVR